MAKCSRSSCCPKPKTVAWPPELPEERGREVADGDSHHFYLVPSYSLPRCPCPSQSLPTRSWPGQSGVATCWEPGVVQPWGPERDPILSSWTCHKHQAATCLLQSHPQGRKGLQAETTAGKLDKNQNQNKGSPYIQTEL